MRTPEARQSCGRGVGRSCRSCHCLRIHGVDPRVLRGGQQGGRDHLLHGMVRGRDKTLTGRREDGMTCCSALCVADKRVEGGWDHLRAAVQGMVGVRQVAGSLRSAE